MENSQWIPHCAVPPISNDPLFSLIQFYQPPPYNFSKAHQSQSMCDLVDSNTMWNSYGYDSGTRSMATTVTKLAGFQTRLSGTFCIRHLWTPGLVQHILVWLNMYIMNPAHLQEVAFIGLSTIFVIEMITFVLAWVSLNHLVDHELIQLCLFSLL